MFRVLLTIGLFFLISTASAERIKRPPPDQSELARQASDEAMNDNLRKGDIISTDHGFLQMRGVKQDGTFDFAPVANPLLSKPVNRSEKR